MITLYRNRLSRALRSVPTIVCITLLMLASGILLTVFNISVGSSSFAGATFYLCFPAAILLPVTVLLSVERMHKKGELAYLSALPLSACGIAAAHLLSALTLLLLSALPLLAAPLVLSLFGAVNLATAYVAILGYLLFGGEMIALSLAVGLCFSRRATRIAVLAGAILLLMAAGLLPARLPISPLAVRTLSGLSPLAMAEGFTYGQFYLVGLISALLFVTVCLLVATLALHLRRGGMHTATKKSVAITLSTLGACLALVLGTLTPYLPRGLAYFDVTGTDTFAVGGKTLDFLKTLDRDVTVYYLCEGGQLNAYRTLEGFLEEYGDASAHIKVKYVDTKKNAAFASRYTDATLNDHSFIVTSGDKYYIIDNSSLYHYYNAELKQNFSSNYYAYCLEAADYYANTGSLGSYDQMSVEYGSGLLHYSAQTTAYFDGDALLANAILYVTGEDTVTVHLLTGNGTTLENNLRTLLASNGYFFKESSAITSLADCDLLFIYSPSRDLTDAETALVRAYVEGGGKLFLATSCAYDDYPNLLSITKSYGLSTAQNKNMLCQKDSGGKYTTSFYASVDTTSPASRGFNGSFAMLMPHLINLNEPEIEGVTHTEWITTTNMGAYVYADEMGDDGNLSDEVKELLDLRHDKYVCGAIAERGDTRIVWLASALSLSIQAYTYSNGGNYSLLLSALNWQTDNTFTPLSIEPRELQSQAVPLTTPQSALCVILLLILPPIIFPLVTGIKLYVRRQKNS